MKRNTEFLKQLIPIGGCLVVILTGWAPSSGAVDQTIDLGAGWNAIWLDVSPIYLANDPNGGEVGEAMRVEHAFDTATNTTITKVATPAKPIGTAEFISDASGISFNQEEWDVWQSTSELGFNSLMVIRGYRGYVVYVDDVSGLTLTVPGKARFFVPDWEPDSYNLVGFSLSGPITFDEFFGPSFPRHPTNQIFSLEPGGDWVAVDPSDDMGANKAFWIFSNGPSKYAGPVSVSFQNIDGGIDFGDGPGNVEIDNPQAGTGGEDDTIFVTLRDLVLTNISSVAQPLSLVKAIPSTTGTSEPSALDDDLRVYDIEYQPESLLRQVGLGQVTDLDFGSIPELSTEVVTLAAYRSWTDGDRDRRNLYKIQFEHHYFWLPMLAENSDIVEDVLGTPDATYQGLWIGQVNLDAVSSITEDGNPVRPATSVAPARVIVHVDESGAPSLLSHVMFMETRTADEAIQPDPLLVVDEEKIPFFEGVETRGGKRIGRRIETISYDMPRKIDIVTQADLLDDVVNASEIDDINEEAEVTEADIENFINSRSSRPIDLEEKYHLVWPLQGAVAPGVVVGTSEGLPLLLDPFHRSNPFRHTFHPRHRAGFAIERAITISFDDDFGAGRLEGDYQETVTGLIAQPLVTRGRITLERVSDVGVLQ